MNRLIEMLEQRGFIDAMTSNEISQHVEKPVVLYVGFDPTADSLHLGHLVSIMGLAWFQHFGHHPIALIGGATGMIGDPSGKSKERNLLDVQTIERNIIGIRRSLESVLKQEVTIVNNNQWFAQMDFLTFLRDIGKHFRLGTMLAKESVKMRLASEEGMSYTEFSYQLLQAYDFYQLYQRHHVTLQLGGSDQWGNITAGAELVRKLTGERVYGLTVPLLRGRDGKKIGKTEGSAVWLNADRLSVYDFYQYLRGVSDDDVLHLLRMLTFLELEEIQEIASSMQHKHYVPYTAQIRLAEEVTKIVHGQSGLEEAIRVTQAAQPGSCTTLDLETLHMLATDLPSLTCDLCDVVGKKLTELIVICGLLSSKGEARRMIFGGGVYLNNQKISDDQLVISKDHLVANQFLLLGIGKKKKLVISVR